MTRQQKLKHLFSLPVIVAALGYFVDIYDLLLFGIVRVPSLQDMSLDPDTLGVSILNWQMSGLLLGGILWGILGDKRGRLSVLFGSIILYSLANVACGFLPHINFMDKGTAYIALRFIAGIGLAGELGAGITLVSESLPKELRAIGTSLVAGFGLFGAVVANFTVELTSHWTIAYWIGGAMGLCLLLLRIGVLESGIFKEIAHDKSVKKGNILMLFNSWKRFSLYLKCIGIGLPTWFCIGILAMLGNQFGKALKLSEEIKPGMAIMWAYIGISAGDFLSGFISHWLASRKKAILYMMLFTLLGVSLMLFLPYRSAGMYYFYCVWLGLGTGYWAMFVTVGAEQFGTNIRSTAATTIPNMVRGTVVLMTLLFDFGKNDLGVVYSGVTVGVICFALGIYSTVSIPETHNREMDFIEK
ncbi:MAG: major facilitator superfamily 1 [Crocinitomicaceae bacterium]|jgi:MFS family permease|nr:major facilitator superfamily 1 [Crocinitomicaceae bacterium]